MGVERWGDSMRDRAEFDRWITRDPREEDYEEDYDPEEVEAPSAPSAPVAKPANDYTAAPATALVATRCACCNRELLDAVSVERGIGPDCAEKYGADEAQRAPRWERAAEALALAGVDPSSLRGWGVDARSVANALIYRCAAWREAPAVEWVVVALAAVGFVRCASKIGRSVASTWAVVETERAEGAECIVVRTSRLDDSAWLSWARAFRAAGASRDAARKAVVAPAKARAQVWDAIRRGLPSPVLVVGTDDVTMVRRAS